MNCDVVLLLSWRCDCDSSSTVAYWMVLGLIAEMSAPAAAKPAATAAAAAPKAAPAPAANTTAAAAKPATDKKDEKKARVVGKVSDTSHDPISFASLPAIAVVAVHSARSVSRLRADDASAA